MTRSTAATVDILLLSSVFDYVCKYSLVFLVTVSYMIISTNTDQIMVC